MGTPSQTQNSVIFQRRAMDVEDYLTVIRRNVGWIVGPILSCLVVAVVVAYLWPDTYVSYASIRVVPPQVPEKYVPTNVNMQMADRVSAMRDTILSRNTLENIIQSFDLYRKERSRLPVEDIIEKMRGDISIGTLTMPGRTRNAGNSAAFQIAFRYENRYMAQRVTRDLMTRFIEENIRERSATSQLTTQFLREKFEEARAHLERVQNDLTRFRVANAGRLPDQMDSNLQQVTSLESRISALNANVARANQEKMLLESDLRGRKEQLNAIVRSINAPSGAARSRAARGEQQDQRLVQLDAEIRKHQRALDVYLEKYKPSYPDVQSLQIRLNALRKEREDYLNEKLALPETGGSLTSDPAPSEAMVRQNLLAISPEVAELNATIDKAQAAIRAKELEAERYLREIAEADRKLREVHSRIESGPLGAGTLEQLMRDYGLAKTAYDELQTKVAASEIASDLEQRKQGETLEVLDLPSLPESPTDPNRTLIITFGAFLGLMIGAALVVVRELKDKSLKTLKDVRAYTQFVVLGSIPLLENDLVVRRRRKLLWVAWSTACLLSVVVVSGSVYYYYATRL